MVDLVAERRLLPIFTAREALIREFTSNLCCLVIGETGSGKTTQIPQVFYEECIIIIIVVITI